MYIRTKGTIVLLCAAILFIYGCPATIRDLSKVQYIKEGFEPGSLEADGLGLLPVIAGQGQEGYRRPLADALNQAIQSSKPEVEFLTWQETMSILNEQELTETYRKAVATYRETSIIDGKLLHRIGEALGVRYLLLVSLEEFHKTAQTVYDPTLGPYTVRTSKVNAFGQIWDCASGDVVWEGLGTAQSAADPLTIEKGYEEHSQIAAEGLVRGLP